MRKIINITVLVFIGSLALSCLPKASEEDCNKMCENLLNLRGEIDTSTEKERIAKVEAQFQKEEKRLTDWMAKDLKGWDDELNAKLAQLKKNKEKKSLEEEYAQKKEVTRQQHLPGINDLKPKKEAAIKKAKEDAAASSATWKKALDECVAEALKEGTPKKIADCRIAATGTDQYWNTCR